MRTEEQRWRPYVEPFRAAAVQARNRLGRGGMRLALLAMLAVAIGGAAWLAKYQSNRSQPIGYEWLYDARPFRSSEAAPVLAALKAADIPCVEAGGRIGVPKERRIDALEVVARAKLGPRGLDDLLDEAVGGGSFWESPDDRLRRERRGNGQVAGKIISRLRGVVSATVILNPIQTGTRLNPTVRLKAMALVETEGGQVLPQATVEMIRHVLTSIDDVDAENVSLFNPTAGQEYLVAGRPEIAVRSSVRGREEELKTRLLEQLRIEGALITVRIDAPPAPVADPSPANPAAAPLGSARVNQPIGVVNAATPDASVETSTPELSLNSAGPAMSAETTTTTPNPASPIGGRATVLVRVPRSHYLRLFRQIEPDRPISPEALAPIAERVQTTVRTVVHALIPPAELGRLTIDRFDDIEPPGPVATPPVNDRRVSIPEWMPVAGAAGLATLVLAALAGGWLASRRPTQSLGGHGAAARGPHLRIPASASDSEEPAEVVTAADDGPGRKIEALVHRDPAAAAGVLRRWINQGGHDR